MSVLSSVSSRLAAAQRKPPSASEVPIHRPRNVVMLHTHTIKSKLLILGADNAYLVSAQFH